MTPGTLPGAESYSNSAPTDLLFGVISSLTGGLITDLTTAMIAMLSIAFICMGIDYLKDVFVDSLNSRARLRYIDEARRERSVMNNSYVDPVYRDMARVRYRNAIRRASQ